MLFLSEDRSAETDERQDSHDDNHEAHEINDSTHSNIPSIGRPERSGRLRSRQRQVRQNVPDDVWVTMGWRDRGSRSDCQDPSMNPKGDGRRNRQRSLPPSRRSRHREVPDGKVILQARLGSHAVRHSRGQGSVRGPAHRSTGTQMYLSCTPARSSADVAPQTLMSSSDTKHPSSRSGVRSHRNPLGYERGH